MGLPEQIVRLARRKDSAGPVASVYLNTHWVDEHQRERTRVFLKEELGRVQPGARDEALAAALDWIEAQASALVGQAAHPRSRGVALFAGADLRETVASRVPFENTLAVAGRPLLRPLATALSAAPGVVVAFVDAEAARLIPVLLAGPGEEVRLDSELPGHHKRGGWAQLAQSRYQRHLEAQRGRHLDAVAEALSRLVEEEPVERIVIAGAADSAAALRRTLDPAVAGQVAATIAGSRHEPASELIARATEALGPLTARETQATVDAILTDAAKGGQAVAGLEGTLEAVSRGAVDRLFLLRDAKEDGGACVGCAALQPGHGATCRRCGQPTAALELGEAMVTRAIATGGAATFVTAHPGLARAGGVAARLRFAP